MCNVELKMLAKELNKITAEDYLDYEKNSLIKHELIDGQVYAMVGASANHRKIAGNIFRAFANHLVNKACIPYMSDARIKTKTDDDYYYPDIVVDCNPHENNNSFYAEYPILIIEIFSKNTSVHDKKQM